MSDQNNNIKQIQTWLGAGGKPVTTSEYREFWAELSEEDKQTLRTMDLG